MRIKKGFITENTKFIKKLMLKTVFAEELEEGTPDSTTPVDNEPQVTTKTPTVNYEDLIAKARQQEKAKLYPQITKLEEEKKALVEKNNANLLLIGEKDAEISELKKQLADTQKNATQGASEKEQELLSKVSELEKELANTKANICSREEIEAEIKAEYEVKLYKEQKLREAGDTIIPELITGATKEEIDASILVSKEKFNEISNRILGGVQVPVGNVSTTSLNTKELKIEDIAKLDPRSPEYAQLRAKIGLK